MAKGFTKKLITALMIGGLMTMGVSGQISEAAANITNPYGLVYGNAITHNEAGKVNVDKAVNKLGAFFNKNL